MKFLTQNLYLGANLATLFGAPAHALPSLASRVWADVRATDFPQRAALLAEAIAPAAPDLIGLQEGALWQVGPDRRVAYDFVELLRAALRGRRLDYAPVVLAPGFTGATRTAEGEALRYSDHDAILARTDGTALGFENAQVGTFGTSLTVTAAGRRVAIWRVWAAVDVRAKGPLFRFVTTHLEAYDGGVRQAQMRELLAGPLATSLPAVLVGDLNDSPGPLLAAGFRDAGPEGRSRIDFVLYRGAWVPVSASLLQVRRDGAWASDHPGVVAALELPDAAAPG